MIKKWKKTFNKVKPLVKDQTQINILCSHRYLLIIPTGNKSTNFKTFKVSDLNKIVGYDFI